MTEIQACRRILENESRSPWFPLRINPVCEVLKFGPEDLQHVSFVLEHFKTLMHNHNMAPSKSHFRDKRHVAAWHLSPLSLSGRFGVGYRLLLVTLERVIAIANSIVSLGSSLPHQEG
jgi:hypothetical protein